MRSREQEYYDALKRISHYQSPEWILAHRDQCLKLWGVLGNEAIEMAYDNVLIEAKEAIRGRKRPADRRQKGAAE